MSYFAPPQFRIKKEDIKKMGADELKEFPLVCCLCLASPTVVSSSSDGELNDTDSGGWFNGLESCLEVASDCNFFYVDLRLDLASTFNVINVDMVGNKLLLFTLLEKLLFVAILKSVSVSLGLSNCGYKHVIDIY